MSITGRGVSAPQGIPSEQELKPMMTDLEEKAEQVRDCSHHVLNVHARLVFMHVPQAAAANARP